MFVPRACWIAAAFVLAASQAAAQTPDSPPPPLFPARESSGTSWQPDETRMDGVERTLGAWSVMAHGSLFAQFLYESGDRHRTGGFASHQFSSANWLMLAARRPAGAGRVGVRAMLTAEPWTVSACGFINLLASGEMCEGDTIHDRQHPHDTFMELSADYDRPIHGPLRWQIYGGVSGEPALGPTAFPHRLSAALNPIAPVTHHWLDSSHMAFGVVTSGVYSTRWKIEGSVFNGREPDETRTNLDLGPLDSFSGRVSLMPSPRLALQVSAGHLEEAEAEFSPRPRSDVDRLTASATYHRALGARIWATTAAYGMNGANEYVPDGPVFLVTHAGLAETSLAGDRDTWFGRVEVAGKPGEDLHVHEAPTQIFTVGKIEAGYVRQFRAWHSLVPGVGAVASANIVPPALATRYSGQVAWGFGVYFVLRPVSHVMHGAR